ncbi:MAG TPA: aldehyde dehydrogenase family protein [Propionicimonas sp.]|nr:aldehyde dehydrogenase family protein [Propionicimonas sp.]
MARPFYLSGVPTTGTGSFEVRSPFDQALVAEVSMPTDAQVEQAVADLAAVRAEAQALPAHVRAAALDHIVHALEERLDEVAHLITKESGKPDMWARGEVRRAMSTFRWASEEARRFSGDLMRLDSDAGGTGRMAIARRFPRGAVLAITPFNFPLNLVAHKVAPALAVGAPILVKPTPKAPLSALLLGELIAQTDLPPQMFSVLPMSLEQQAPLLADPRLPVISFTGSDRVGALIRAAAPDKHVITELGGDAAVIVAPDWTDLRTAAARIGLFGCYQAGQSCIGVQRVIVHASLVDEFTRELVLVLQSLRQGDPADAEVQVGPVIDQDSATRIIDWVTEATDRGARLLTGGTAEGTTVAPTLLADVPSDARIATNEVFGPVLTIATFETMDEAYAMVNSSRYGLQAGVFTSDIQTAFAAHQRLEVGGVIIGDVPTFRADQMSYGGWKASGQGREGVASAMADITDDRLLVLTGLPL